MTTNNSEAQQMKPINNEAQQMKPFNSEAQQMKPSNGEAQQKKPSNGEVQQMKPSNTKTYCVKYEDNNSKRWDGKTVMIDGEQLHSVCNMCEIHCGDKINLPWTAKKGKVQYWNAVVVDDAGVKCGDFAQSKSLVASDNTKNAISSSKSKKIIKSQKTTKGQFLQSTVACNICRCACM